MSSLRLARKATTVALTVALLLSLLPAAVHAADAGPLQGPPFDGYAWSPLPHLLTHAAIHRLVFTDSSHGVFTGSSGVVGITSDGGANWRQPTLLPTVHWLGVATLADGRAWAYGQAGNLQFSNNAGKSWSRLDSGTRSDLKGGVFFTAGATTTGILVGKSGTIMVSADGGGHWQAATSGVSVDLSDVTRSDANHTIAVGNQGVILTSVDGVTWVPQNSIVDSDLHRVTFASPLQGWAVGSGGVILSTAYGGKTWTQQNSGTSHDLYGLSFSDTMHGWVSGANNTLLTTADGGSTWRPVTTTATMLSSVISPDQAHVLAAGYNCSGDHCSGLVLSSADGGNTWTAYTAAHTWFFGALSFIDHQHGIVVGSNLEIKTTADGGATWIGQFAVNPIILRGLAMADAQHGWAAGSFGSIYVTTDGGAHWTAQDRLLNSDYTSVFALDAQHAWIVSNGGSVLSTTDGGLHWSRQKITDNALYWITFADGSHGWAGGARGQVFATSDGGSHWAPQAPAAVPDTVNLEHAFFLDAMHGWIVGGQGTLLSTSDGGSSWRSTHLDTSSFLNDVFFTDAQHGWVVGANGMIFATADGAQTWVAQLSGTNAHLYCVFFTDPQHGWAAGVFGKVLIYAVTPPAFTDLDDVPWAQAAIVDLAAKGIVKGVGPGRFNPQGTINRAQFAALMQRIFQLDAPSSATAYPDVSPDDWFYGAAQALTPYMGGSSFFPDRAIDRQNVAAVIVRILVARGKLSLLSDADSGTVLSSVSDAGAIDAALAPYVATAINAGIMKGLPDGTFGPTGSLTRAQVAVLLQRLITKYLS